jgi:hypothetical protein
MRLLGKVVPSPFLSKKENKLIGAKINLIISANYNL